MDHEVRSPQKPLPAVPSNTKPIHRNTPKTQTALRYWENDKCLNLCLYLQIKSLEARIAEQMRELVKVTRPKLEQNSGKVSTCQ